MKRSFERALGVGPREYRLLHFRRAKAPKRRRQRRGAARPAGTRPMIFEGTEALPQNVAGRTLSARGESRRQPRELLDR
jgi:hypothetical protein